MSSRTETLRDQPQPLDDARLAEYAALISRTTPMGAVTASPGILNVLLAEVQRLKAELADFSGRVNELESSLCNCEPTREHDDYRRPAFYQHAVGCPVNDPNKAAEER